RMLSACLMTLPASGVAAFRFEDFVSVLKDRVRQAHAERNRLPDSEIARESRADQDIGEIIRIARPEAGYQEREEGLQLLLRRMREAINATDTQERTRKGLHRLLEELAHHAETEEEVPSWAELARRLGVRRTTLWDHLVRLRELARHLPDATD